MFEIGQHVKVLGGLYAGETGTVLTIKRAGPASDANGADAIVDTDAFLAVLLLDSAQKQVRQAGEQAADART